MEWEPLQSSSTPFDLKRSIKDEYQPKKRICLSKSRAIKKEPSRVTIASWDSTIDSKPHKIKQQTQQVKQEPKVENLFQLKPKSESLFQTILEVKTERKPLECRKESSNKNIPSEEYACPICEIDLTYIKSSYLRQNHVEACINAVPKEEEELEFNECVFCSKDLLRLKFSQRQVHLNNCLDEIKVVEEDPVFAGQRIPFLETLEICPVCHDTIPFVNKSLKQKIQHTKRCAKQNRLTMDQLLRKFRWIGWGHLPVAAGDTSAITISDNTQPKPSIPNHQLIFSGMLDVERDDDFSDTLMIHKTTVRQTAKPTREEDLQNEELQTILAISKSMAKPDTKKKRLTGIRPSDERDWNAANIWSMEESRREAVQKLGELLFSNDNEIEQEESIDCLQASRLPNHNIPSLWNLASNRDSNWDHDLIFVSLFLRKQNKLNSQ